MTEGTPVRPVETTHRGDVGLVALSEVVREIVSDVVAEVLLEVLVQLEHLDQAADVQTLEVAVGERAHVTARLDHHVAAVLQVPLYVAPHQVTFTWQWSERRPVRRASCEQVTRAHD